MLTATRPASRSRLFIALLVLETAFTGIPRAAAADSPRPAFEIMELRAPESDREFRGPTAPRELRGAGRAPGQVARPGATSADALDVEPNETAATATPLTGTHVVVRANIFPAGDLDFYSFPATAGDRVYAAVQTLFDASASGDTVLDLLDTDGATVIESDNNDGTFNGSASSLAGVLIPSTGTFFLRVRHNLVTGTIRPYDLHFKQMPGAPTAEVEPNNAIATANPLPASGWVSGTITAGSPGEFDLFSIVLNAGDSVYLSLDMNPERDVNVWNGRLGFGLFGNPPANQVLIANDPNAGASPADPNSEAFFFTVLTAGTYYVYLDSVVAAGLGANATYNLSVAVHPAPVAAGTCTTYTSTNVPVAIPADPGSATSTLTIPGNPRIADLDVTLNLNHDFMQDVDVHLISPAGNDNGLFTDVGSATSGGAQTLMDLRIDDEAALPFAFALSASIVVQPEPAYRLSWFDGENAGGTWTLQMRDDAGGDGGTLNSWSLTVCEPPPPASCAVGFAPQTVFTTDFESSAAGFTHSGALDEWELGLPTFSPITTCNSGTSCWKTDLDNTYDASSDQNLLSPNINLAGLAAPVVVTWAQRYQLQTATSDNVSVDYQQVGGAAPVRLFEWWDATMTDTVGNPGVIVNESSGWSTLSARADSLAGLNTELRFHLNSNPTVQLAGLAIDDVGVTACRPLLADLAITKTDGVATAVPGGSVAYTITASNAGGDAAPVATVADTFPATLFCTWTCTGAGGGTCTAAGTGNINDPVNLPVGGSVTYAAACTIAPSATGSLVNTATVSSSLSDPNAANNSATDTDTLTPQADLKVTKTDGQTTARVGQPITYTIVAANAGPSSSPGATVTDALPAALTGAAWTCTGAGGGACTATGSGSINDVVDLPVGGSVTYILTATVADLAGGSLANTATVAAPGGVSDPNPGDNSATDTDTAAAGDFFYSLDPCRILDTRGGAPIGGPAIAGQETRTLAVAGTCGVPATAKAIVVNLTVTQSNAAGHVALFAAGQPPPAVSNINYSPAQTRANSAVVALSATGAVDAFVGQPTGTSVHVIIDVSGYFE